MTGAPVTGAAEAGPRVSVVVVTRDRPQPLLDCLTAVLASTQRPDEVVVLDNGDPDGREALRAAIEALDGWSAPGSAPGAPRLSLLHAAPRGFARLRAEACAAASGDLLVSLDDDCRPAPDALERIVETFAARPRAGVVGGRLENVGFSGPERFKGRGRLGPNARYETVEDGARAEVFGSANQTLRRAAFEQVGGYDPFFSDGLEEADLALKLRRAGWETVYAPDVAIEHRHVPNRHRGRGRNLNTMRLYLFFKHFPPRGAAAWARFAAHEAALLAGDLLHQVRGFPARLADRRGARSFPRRLLAAAGSVVLESAKAKIARLRIPELWWRARRAPGAAP